MTYDIISTGSKGNAVVLNDVILIDCGIPFSALEQYLNKIQIVFLTHIHGDHFNKSTISRLATKRPSIRFVCGEWLVIPLLSCGVKIGQIDRITGGSLYDYGKFQIQPFLLHHNVENLGYKIFMDGEKIFYATDTGHIDDVKAKNFDMYFIEANYEDEEIWERIQEKENRGEYAYEREVLKNHLSLAQCDDFLVNNLGAKSKFIYMHGHFACQSVDKERE